MHSLISPRQLTKLFLLGVVVLGLPLFVHAQTQSLEISPFKLELNVAKGDTVAAQIDLTNHGTDPMAIKISARNFLPGPDGRPQFVPESQTIDPTYALASWIKLNSSDQVTVEPGQTLPIHFSVNPPSNAEQGSHYGALLFTYGSATANGGSSVQQSVGAILLVRFGQGQEIGTLQSSVSKNLLWNVSPVTFTNKFVNTGNVHVQPKGEVKIKNMFGQLTSTPQINRDAANVLPKSDRTFTSTWTPNKFSFGRYTAESVVTFGQSKKQSSDKVVIWILPWYLILTFAIVVVIILWLIFSSAMKVKSRVQQKNI